MQIRYIVSKYNANQIVYKKIYGYEIDFVVRHIVMK